MDRDRIMSAFELQQRDRGKSSPATAGATLHRYTVRSDLPAALKARRAILATKAYHMRKDRGVSTKIIVKGAEVALLWKEKGTAKWNNFQD